MRPTPPPSPPPARQIPLPPAPANLPPYNARVLFSPDYLNQVGPATRTAGGQPAASYWQNAADYQIAASLDEKAARVSATVAITYTNNSPNALPFVWLQLDQNLFRGDSRGSRDARGRRALRQRRRAQRQLGPQLPGRRLAANRQH
ncbi:hypothetical protein [Hymenobacter coccineus]|uniref:hypothetical protein n=1 Tax=Hymenobacter coccineus TaxID=1908235 RepID=UPI001EFAACAC|nr:hypothetical protein [Hymenobacter coccineus]